MRAFIIEDEPSSIVYMENFIKKHFPNIIVEAKIDNVNEAILKINELEPDILFLDITLKDGNSFEILEKIDYKNKSLIFITAYDSYAVKAFKYSSIDYILKPFEDQDLIDAINKIDFKLSKKNNYDNLISSVKNHINQLLIVKTNDGFQSIDKSQIIRIESSSNYSTLYLLNGTSLLSAKTLGNYEEILTDSGFYRIHNSHLINIVHFKSYKTKDGGYILMHNGDTLPISQRRKHEFLEFIGSINN